MDIPMEMTETIGGLPAVLPGDPTVSPVGPAAAPVAQPPASDTEMQALVDRVLEEVRQRTGKPTGRDELLLHLLDHPGHLGQEALRHLGARSQRLRDELQRLTGAAGDLPAARPERTPWPLGRWVWVAAAISVVSYPLSVGPVLVCLQALGVEDDVTPAFEMLYAPLIWLYDSVPWVEAFYDWYMKFFGIQ